MPPVGAAAHHLLVLASASRFATTLLVVLATVTTPAGAGVGAEAASPRTRSGRDAHVAVPDPSDPAFRLPLPSPPVVLTAFDPPGNPYGPGHRGVDLAGSAGEVVRAAGAGTVLFAGDLAGRGVVSIQHPSGLRTTYEPVTATMTAGAAVSAGDPIGVLEAGHPTCAPATCLHWGARLPDGRYLDPMALLRPWRVRLLPWDKPPTQPSRAKDMSDMTVHVERLDTARADGRRPASPAMPPQ